MADESAPSIREVLEEAAGKEADADPTKSPTPNETEAAPSSSPTPTGDGKGEESLESVDPKLREKIEAKLAKLSPEEREDVLRDLKNYDRGFHRSMQKVSEFRKFAEGLARQFPEVTASEIEEAIRERRNGKVPSAPAKSEEITEEDIDALINKASDPAIREELRKSKQVLHREMDKRLTEKLKPIQEELERLKQTAMASRASTLDGEIDALEDVEGFSSSFIEKHREQIRIYALKWNLPVKEVLAKVVPFDELSEAFATRKSQATNKTNSAPKTSPARTVSASPATAGSLEKFKEPRGGWNIKGALRSLAR